jgi:hypothetical protein
MLNDNKVVLGCYMLCSFQYLVVRLLSQHPFFFRLSQCNGCWFGGSYNAFNL